MKDDIVSINNINYLENLKGAWKRYNFNNQFDINARSKEEALKKIKAILSKSGFNGIDSEYFTEKHNSGTLFKFTMSNINNNCTHQCMALTAADAWDDLRGNFIYDEHIVLVQIVNMPCVVSPKWRTLDVINNLITPDFLTHHVVIAVGLANESWWSKSKNVIPCDENGFICDCLINSIGKVKNSLRG